MVEPSVSFASAFIPKAALLVGLSVGAFYSQQHLKVLGGNLPSRDMMSWRPEHKEAERRRFVNMVRDWETSLPNHITWAPGLKSLCPAAGERGVTR